LLLTHHHSEDKEDKKKTSPMLQKLALKPERGSQAETGAHAKKVSYVLNSLMAN
jgi:hypothetical protein